MMQWLLFVAACGGTCPDTVPGPAGDGAVQDGPAPLEVEIAHSRETLTRGRGDWTETSVRVTHREGPRRLIFLQGRYLTRFGREDGDLTLGTVFPVAPELTLSLDAGFSPAPVFLPEWQTGGVLSYALGGGWVLGYGLRHLEYSSAPTLVQQGIADHYFGPFLVGYTLTHTHVRGGGAGVAHTGRTAWFYGGGSNVSAGATFGRSAETLAPEDVRLIDLRSMALWGVHWLDGGTGLTWSVGWHRHGDLFERSGVTLGVRQRL
jgi:YaiO family outer membrane protein